MPATTDTRQGAVAIVTVERKLTAVVKTRVPMNRIPDAERSARAKLDATLPALDVGRLGASFTLWRPPVQGELEMEPGTIVSRDFAPAGDVIPSSLPAGRAAQLRLVGPYDRLPGAWETLFDWCRGEGLTLAGVNWQIYEGEDATNPQTLLQTLLM